MKKICLFVLPIFFLQCGPAADSVETIVEDGVEVVLNRLEPYRVPGESADFTLEEEFRLDFENDELAGLGIGAVGGFDSDSRGCLYLLSQNLIFKFDPRGRFLLKFGRVGQGPGEYTRIGSGRILETGELVLYDGGNDKFLFYSPEGVFLREIKNTAEIPVFGGSGAVYLDNRSFLFEQIDLDPEKDSFCYFLTVLDADFKKVADLRERAFKENPFRGNRYNLFDAYIKYRIHRNRLYVVNQANPDFEINIYDFQGNNLKRIRTDYERVRITEEFKDKALDSYKNSEISQLIKTKGYFPDSFPPVQNIYVEDGGKILCESYEEENYPPRVFLYVFSSEGAFIGKIPLEKAQARRFKNGRLYAVFEKETGYQEMVVSRVNWRSD